MKADRAFRNLLVTGGAGFIGTNFIRYLFERTEIDAVGHFAAESHVDRSILWPREFVNTNVMGTFTLLEAARAAWKERRDVLFHHVSTDEVYGSLGAEGLFTETTPYSPRSPYSTSKAASDHLVRAYHHTYGLPITLSPTVRTTTVPISSPRSSSPS